MEVGGAKARAMILPGTTMLPVLVTTKLNLWLTVAVMIAVSGCLAFSVVVAAERLKLLFLSYCGWEGRWK